MSIPAAGKAKIARAEQPDWPGPTVEAVLYAALFVAAAFIRFYDLGRWPLLTEEARYALAAWRFLHGQGTGGAVTPLPFGGALLSFFVFGVSDAAARLLPVLLGVALVLLPLALRHRLGGWGALAVAFMLAFSPTLVFYSRTLAGPVPALAGLGAVLWALDLAARRQAARARVAGGVGLAVALTSSPWTYTFLLAAGLFLGLGYLASRRGQPWPGWAAGKKTLGPFLADRNAWAGMAIVLIPVSTAFLLNPGGVQGLADLLWAWLGSLVPGAAGRSWLYPLGILAFYEVGVVLLGATGLGLALLRPNHWARFLGVWALLALFLAGLSGARDAGPMALAVLPLALLGGTAVDEVAARLQRPQWVWVGIGLGLVGSLFGFWWLQLVAYSAPYPHLLLRSDLGLIGGLSMVTPILLAVSVATFWHWVGRRETVWVVTVAGLALLGALLLRSSVALSQVHARDPREPLVVAPSSIDLKDMVRFLEDWSVRQALDQHALSVAVTADLDPLVPWYLREFDDLRLVRAHDEGADYGALIRRAHPGAPAVPGYAGKRYTLRRHAEAPLGTGNEMLSWWLVRSRGGKVHLESIELWVKP